MKADTHDWSPQQRTAITAVEAWCAAETKQQVFRLFGYAGTGKTTLALAIARLVRQRLREAGESTKEAVLFAAFTGKAALVMQSKGCAGASTIHSLIYSSGEDEGGPPEFALNPASKLADAKLLIVDECSMVGDELAKDMLSFGVKVLVLGDPAQLPPVGDGLGYFTNATPDVMLTEVHRQAADNPIIRLSMDIRNGVRLEFGDHGACKVVRWSRDAVTTENPLAFDQLLAGKNVTVGLMNDRVRKLKKYERDTPLIGEKLVCLKNDRNKGLFNGGLWRVLKLGEFHPEKVAMIVEPDDAGEVARSVDVKVHKAYFEGSEKALTWEQIKGTQQFRFGYALTVHKAQGSQWDNVMLFDESRVFGSDATRWLYTGVTRAAQKLTVVMA